MIAWPFKIQMSRTTSSHQIKLQNWLWLNLTFTWQSTMNEWVKSRWWQILLKTPSMYVNSNLPKGFHIVRKLLKMSHFFLIFKKSSKLTLFGIFNELLSTQNVNVARFARNVEWDIFCYFQNTVGLCTLTFNWILDKNSYL